MPFLQLSANHFAWITYSHFYPLVAFLPWNTHTSSCILSGNRERSWYATIFHFNAKKKQSERQSLEHRIYCRKPVLFVSSDIIIKKKGVIFKFFMILRFWNLGVIRGVLLSACSMSLLWTFPPVDARQSSGRMFFILCRRKAYSFVHPMQEFSKSW